MSQTSKSAHQVPGASREVLDHIVEGPSAWVTANAGTDWQIQMDAEAVEELRRVVHERRIAPLPLLRCSAQQFALPACRRLMQAVHDEVTRRTGIAVIGGLPVEEFQPDELRLVFWLLGQLLSRPVATKWDGTMLYDVADKGVAMGYGVRASSMNAELYFHTDNSFGRSVPDFVGLLCINPSDQGGVSRFCSLYSVHNELLRDRSHALPRLYESMYFDRQAEHHPSESKLLRAPLFAFDEEGLHARLSFKLIRKGYELANEPMDQRLSDSLEALHATLEREDLCIQYRLERGDIQFINNHWGAHARSAFADSAGPTQRRLLVRMWLRTSGQETYDG